jgi:hypothetical protein
MQLNLGVYLNSMDNSIGDILYIVVMVAALIFSIYKKSKAQNQDGTVRPEEEVGDPLDEVFPTFTMPKPKPAEPIERPVKQPPRLIQTEAVPRIRTSRTDFHKIKTRGDSKRLERSQRLTTHTSPRKSTQEPELEQHYYWEEEPVDLQRAIIYAEVIKRPDY